MAFYCGGPDNLGDTRDALVHSTEEKEIALPEPMPKLESTILPPKPWVTLERLDSSRHADKFAQGSVCQPKFETLGMDSFHTELNSSLKIFQVRRCFNSTRADVTFFTWSYCKGSPVFYEGKDKEILDKMFCMSTPN